MPYRIVAVRTANKHSKHESEITDIKLDTFNDFVENKDEAVKDIDSGEKYYFTYEDKKFKVESVHPTHKIAPYIRAVADDTTKNNLLDLPRF